MSRDVRVRTLQFRNEPLACESRFLLAGALFALVAILFALGV